MLFLKLFPQLYLRPITTLSRLMDEGEWLPAALSVVAVSVLLQFGLASRLYEKYEAPAFSQSEYQQTVRDYEEMVEEGEMTVEQKQRRIAMLPAPTEVEQMPLFGALGRWLFSFSTSSVLTTLLALALLYVPATLLLLGQLEYLGSFGVLMQRMYGSLLICTLTVWSAAHLPFALLGFASSANGALVLWLGAKLVFGILMICALRTISGATMQSALITVNVSWLALLLYGPFMLIARSFPLFWALPIALGSWAFYSGGYSQQRSFRRSLHAATVNDHDGEAQYQLGLIYQQRRQFDIALTRFQRAVEIDPREIDAHFQLGRIAREQGRYSDAINHFGKVISLDEKHSLYETWREVGATYFGAGMYQEAREALDKFINRREYDPEGLYWLGETMAKLGDATQARDLFARSRDAAASMPYHRRRETGQWGKRAKGKLATL